MMPNIYKYQNIDDYANDSAEAIEDFIGWRLQENDSVSIGLSGGKSPVPVYKKLSQKREIEWDKVELFMVDERYTPSHSEGSNFQMIESTLLSKIPPIKFFYGFNTELPLKKAAEEYDERLESRKQKGFDLVILGMGEDGHTASLFPGTEAVKEKTKLATTCISPDGLDRLSITLSTILSSGRVMFLVRGKNKEKLLDKLQDSTGTADSFPAKMVVDNHEHVDLFFLDN